MTHRGMLRRVGSTLLDIGRTLLWARHVARWRRRFRHGEELHATS